MTPKERVIKVITGQEADRPPVFTTVTPQTAKKLSDHLGLPYEEPLDSLLSTRISHMGLLTAMGNDCVGISACAPNDQPTRKREDGLIVNDWGMVFKDIGLYSEFAEFPLEHAATVADIENYPFPDPNATGRYDEARKTVAKYGDKYAVVGDIETSFWETAWYLVGLEKLMIDMMLEAPYVEPLFDRIMEINLEIGRNLLPQGPPERIKSEVKRVVEIFGKKSGYILAPAHNIQDDTPIENILAMFEAVLELAD